MGDSLNPAAFGYLILFLLIFLFILGLLFQPSVDDIPVIHYRVADKKTYVKYINQLDFFVNGKVRH